MAVVRHGAVQVTISARSRQANAVCANGSSTVSDMGLFRLQFQFTAAEPWTHLLGSKLLQADWQTLTSMLDHPHQATFTPTGDCQESPTLCTSAVR